MTSADVDGNGTLELKARARADADIDTLCAQHARALDTWLRIESHERFVCLQEFLAAVTDQTKLMREDNLRNM